MTAERIIPMIVRERFAVRFTPIAGKPGKHGARCHVRFTAEAMKRMGWTHGQRIEVMWDPDEGVLLFFRSPFGWEITGSHQAGKIMFAVRSETLEALVRSLAGKDIAPRIDDDRLIVDVGHISLPQPKRSR